MFEPYALMNLETSIKDPVLEGKLRPSYGAACKRSIMSPDWVLRVHVRKWRSLIGPDEPAIR